MRAPFLVPLMICLSWGAAAAAGGWESGFGPAGTDRPVSDLLVDGNRLYVAGTFYLAGGVRSPGVALWDESAHTWTALMETRGWVISLAKEGTDLYATGGFYFPAEDGTAMNVARWDTNTGTWHVMGEGLHGEGYAIAAGSGSIYVGGNLSTVDGSGAVYIARWDIATGTWHALGDGVDGSVYSLAVSGDNVYVGGQFYRAGSVYAGGLAKWNASTETWSSLNGPVGNSFLLDRLAITPDGDLMAAGSGQLWLWKESSQSWQSLDLPNVDGYLHLHDAEPAPNGDLYVATNEETLWRWDGQAWHEVAGGLPCQFCLALMGTKLFVGGCDLGVDGVGAQRIARLDLETQEWSALDDGASRGVQQYLYTIAVGEEDAYIGGDFRVAGSVLANGVAAWNGDTFRPLGGGIPGGSVWTILPVGDDVYVGGRFAEAGGMPAGNVARWNETSLEWDVLEAGVSGGVEPVVWNLQALGEDILVSGEFTDAGGVTANSLALWHPASRTWTALGDGPARGVDGVVYQVEILDDRIYIGGIFGRVGALDDGRTHTMAVRDRDSGVWSYLGDGHDDDVAGTIWKFARRGLKLYVGGYFKAAGGKPARNLAVLDLVNHTWTSLPGGLERGWTQIDDMAWLGKDLIVVGQFEDLLLGGDLKGIAVWNSRDGWSGFYGGIDAEYGAAEVFAVESFRGGLLVGGRFSDTGGVVALDFGSWSRSAGAGSATATGTQPGLDRFRSWPNPMGSRATIQFGLDRAGPVRLEVFDIQGRRVAGLVDRELPEGTHTLSWDGTAGGVRLPPGIYLCRLLTPSGVRTHKLLMTTAG